MSNKITYRQQYTRCGKERCRKCRDGAGHGPYWYAYWSEKGRTVSKYIGIHLPLDAEESISQHLHTQEIQIAAGEPAHEITSAEFVPTSSELRVYLLGQFRVERNSEQGWRVIDHRIWQRRRARSLLGCLLNSPGRRLGREQVMELLWPDLDVDISSNRLNGAVHELRQILEPDLQRPAASRMLRLEHDVLELEDNEHIWVDVDAFETLLKEADLLVATQPLQAEYKLEEATLLYSGGYLLEEIYSEWATPRRDALQRRWTGTLLELSHLYTQRGAFASAIEALDRLRVADPTNETALQRLMVLLTHIGRRGEALHIYRQHAATLQREYEGIPLPETRQLFESLQAGDSSEGYLDKWIRHSPKGLEHIVTPTKQTALSPYLSPRPLFQSGRLNQSPLVGRNSELQTMHEVLIALEHLGKKAGEQDEMDIQRPFSEAASFPGPRRPHLLLLTGEPGLGKTRLAEELSTEALSRNWMIVWSRVHEQDGNVPYHPWRDILRSLLPDTFSNDVSPKEIYVMPGLPAFQLDWLSPLLPELTSSLLEEKSAFSYEQERLHLWEATLGFLSTLSEQRPLLLVLDDLHWADESSIELLTYLAHHLQDQRILLVGTCRDDELAPVHKLRSLVSALRREQAIVTLAIQPLTFAQIGVLVAHLPQELVAHVQALAAGNPLFAEELARYAATQHQNGSNQSNQLREEGPSYSSVPSTFPDKERIGGKLNPPTPLPEIVTALLERRLYRLSGECQALLGKAAVLGGSFELRQLLPLASEYSEDSLLDLLDEALQEGLLIEEGMGSQIIYHFWHPLIVNHLYERLSAARRAQLHRRAAESLIAVATPLSREKLASTIVYHLLRGGSNTAQMVYYAELAGNQARTLTAYAEAHYYYLCAIQARVDTPDSFSSYASVESVDVTKLLEDISTFLTAYTSYSPLHSPDTAQRYDLIHLCRLLERAAECDSILGLFEEERHIYECILTIRTNAAFQHYLSTSYAQDDTESALANHYLWDMTREAQIQALLWREMSATWVATGDYDRAYACCEHGRVVMQHAGITDGTTWACLCSQIGCILRYKGNYQEARHYAQEALTMLDHMSRATTTKQLSSSQTRTERALNGDSSYLGQAHELMGIIEASEGHISNALAHLHIALHMYEQQELVSEVILVCGNIGACYIMKGDLDAGRTFLHRALDLAERVGDLPNLAFITGNLGDIAYRSGNLLEAEEWFTRSMALAERVHDREHISWCCVVLANVQQDLGRLHKAAKSLRRAISTGRAIKNSRCIRFALVSLGDLRIVESIIACKLQSLKPQQNESTDESMNQLCSRLLQRAKSTLQRAISQEEIEKESVIDCKLLLATVYYLLDQLPTAQTIALQTMQEAQSQETSRAIGRTQRLLGRIFATQHRHAEADAFFEQALTLFQQQGFRLDYARTLHSYGLTLVQRSQSQEYADEQRASGHRGMQYLYQARDLFADAHASIDLALIELTIAEM